jgi:hypothetical protein
MPASDFLWTDEIVEHLAEHGIPQDDFEKVVCNPISKGYSRSSGRFCRLGVQRGSLVFCAVGLRVVGAASAISRLPLG